LVDVIEESGWTSPADLVDVERTAGIRTHAELGAELSAAWGWPAELGWTIAHHHDRRLPTGSEDARNLAAIVRVADVASTRHGTSDPESVFSELLGQSDVTLPARARVLAARWESIAERGATARRLVGLPLAA
jgi:HD-like signal output (HDOD) protein